jgi:hypothetical protein
MMRRKRRLSSSWGDGLVDDPREKNMSRWWRDTRRDNNKLSCFDHTFKDDDEFDSFLYAINPHGITHESWQKKHTHRAKRQRRNK